ncbi:diguanylate cyclase (GGDEF)-like protein [Herbaspirillum sp. Sphag1AN]|uniref:putative bifunctional diguanylate cyclase/phosphodiesterase n=1 Tax=unclassified Herbaspirillum TaxID=2624150 RepID=UPI00161F4F86|nr:MULTISPECIES: bifunctional diguanylate cyclase/phosphodiesterase [unclassified Herbaspirillum]MBB3214211.1 diguanylate cyclase (GGDEF)-like protein [Herbaspirillum sp. Sphag1AN]MBB3247237.1 diguanylate cyclase (GGDEF)-like protein [Herbaspirillum sp. Sphag64]
MNNPGPEAVSEELQPTMPQRTVPIGCATRNAALAAFFPKEIRLKLLSAFSEDVFMDGVNQRLRKQLRMFIYALLLLVIACGISLSLVMQSTVQNIHSAVAPLIQWEAISPAMTDIQELLREDGLINSSLRRVAHLVHWFNFLALLTAMFLMYHIWARFRSEDALAHQAAHDPLTGLGHRRALERRLRSLRGQTHALILGSVDRFERVIGAYGYEFADQMIVDIACRLHTTATAHQGEVYRLDGANFVILYPHPAHTSAFDMARKALQTTMRSPFVYRKHEVFPSLSLGAVEYPHHCGEPATLLRNADAALQSAREAGGNTLVIYSEELNQETQRRVELEAQLMHALQREELELHYQPQQRLRDDALIGFEALVRWRRGDTLISPADFIPIAEESGLVIAIGDKVLERACLKIRELRALTGEHVVIAVNIAPRQFLHPDFLPKIERLLQATQIEPTSLELEITEGAVMEQTESAIKQLHHLRALGLKLSIDDFGTGYSSLSYLKRFPINKLKIDQSFVRQLKPHSQDSAIVEAVIGLGHTLGIDVIAEGVETHEQREWLKRLSCDEIQGYYYSRPLPCAQVLPFVQSQSSMNQA